MGSTSTATYGHVKRNDGRQGQGPSQPQRTSTSCVRRGSLGLPAWLHVARDKRNCPRSMSPGATVRSRPQRVYRDRRTRPPGTAQLRRTTRSDRGHAPCTTRGHAPHRRHREHQPRTARHRERPAAAARPGVEATLSHAVGRAAWLGAGDLARPARGGLAAADRAASAADAAPGAAGSRAAAVRERAAGVERPGCSRRAAPRLRARARDLAAGRLRGRAIPVPPAFLPPAMSLLIGAAVEIAAR